MKLGHRWRRGAAGALVLALACAGTAAYSAPARASVSEDLNLDTGSGYLQTMADIAMQAYCNAKRNGNYFDALNSQQVMNDVMNAAVGALGPLGTVMEMTRDASDYLGNVAVTSWLNAGETQLDNELQTFDQGSGFSNLPADQLTNFENYIDQAGFTTSEGTAIADAALASYGSVVQGIPASGIDAYVADHRGMVNSNAPALQTGLQIMLLRHMQGDRSTWTSPSLSQFVVQMLGDKFGLVSLTNWIWEQAMNANCDDGSGLSIHSALDPNSIDVTPAGAGGQGWVPAAQALTYTIHFENEPTATAAAVDVRVTAALDAGLDPATVQPGSSSFAGTQFSFDPTSGLLVWTLPDINLPPDTSPPAGEGWVSFTASPKAGLAGGTSISESAQVYFDYNPPVQTNTVSVAIDGPAPTVTMQPVTAGQAGSLQLAWQGTSLSGIESYTVYASMDGGQMQPVAVTSQTSTTFAASAGHSYGFAVQATDVVGLSSPVPTSAQASYGVSAASSGGDGGSGGAAGPSPASGPTVGPGGGTLESSDGSFSVSVPGGSVPVGQSLSVSTSGSTPSAAPGLPPGFSAASYFVTLTGAALDQPAAATIKDTAPVGEVASVFADGAWHYVPTSAGPSGSVQAYVSGPETLVVLASNPQFSDLPSGFWAYDVVRTLAGAGIVSGFPDGTFQPDGSLTRAQFVKMLDMTLNLPASSAPTSFTDVAAGDWFAPYVAAAVQAGLVQGTSPTTFSPDATVTREQMAVLLQRALKLTGSASLSFTDDAQIDPWAQGGVAAAVAAGYVSGFPGGTFQPLGPTTRAQAAKVLALAIAHMAPPAAS